MLNFYLGTAPLVYLFYFLPPVIFLIIARALFKATKQNAETQLSSALIRRYNYYFISLTPFFCGIYLYIIFSFNLTYAYIAGGAGFVFSLLFLIIFWIPKQKNEFSQISDPSARQAAELLFGDKRQYFRIFKLLLIMGIGLTLLGVYILVADFSEINLTGAVLAISSIIIGIIMLFFSSKAIKKDKETTKNNPV